MMPTEVDRAFVMTYPASLGMFNSEEIFSTIFAGLLKFLFQYFYVDRSRMSFETEGRLLNCKGGMGLRCSSNYQNLSSHFLDPLLHHILYGTR